MPVTHYNDPLTASSLGNSRNGGDAPLFVKQFIVEEIIQQGREAGLSNKTIANLLAIAKIESGFNPDAAAIDPNFDRTSASGVFQITDTTANDMQVRILTP